MVAKRWSGRWRSLSTSRLEHICARRLVATCYFWTRNSNVKFEVRKGNLTGLRCCFYFFCFDVHISDWLRSRNHTILRILFSHFFFVVLLWIAFICQISAEGFLIFNIVIFNLLCLIYFSFCISFQAVNQSLLLPQVNQVTEFGNISKRRHWSRLERNLNI